jgi:hypothetical protein
MCVPPRPAGSAPTDPDALGIAACDTYLAVYRCYLKMLPEAARVPAEEAYSKMVESWRKSLTAAGGAARKNITKGCQTALDAFVKALKGQPRARRCLPKNLAKTSAGTRATPRPTAPPRKKRRHRSPPPRQPPSR